MKLPSLLFSLFNKKLCETWMTTENISETLYTGFVTSLMFPILSRRDEKISNGNIVLLFLEGNKEMTNFATKLKKKKRKRRDP